MPKGIYKHKPHSEETKKKMSLNSAHNRYWLGKKRSYVSDRMIGNKYNKGGYIIKDTSKMGHPNKFKGKHLPEDYKNKIRQGHLRNKPYNYIEDRSKLKTYGEANKDRRSSAYGSWRREVYKRDNYKCRINDCNCNGRIIAHHILSYTKYPELRYNINNGITLCQFHHPLKRIEEQRLIPFFQSMVEVKLT